MKKRKWLLLVLLALAIWAYIGLFYKTYSREMVPKNADAILMLDIKRITNTIIWNTITTPSQWKIGKIFSKRKKEVRLKDMIDIPDYVMAFHVKGQPAGAWFLVLKIADEKDFQKGLQQYHFLKNGNNEYVTGYGNFRLLKNGNKILLGRSSEKYREAFHEVADELFVRQEFVPDEMIQKTIHAKSHLALQVNAGNILESDGMLTANFDKNKIVVDGKFTPGAEYVSEEMKMTYNETSFYTIGFVQPTAATYSLLSDSAKQQIKRAINVDMDSVFLPGRYSYDFDLKGIISRTDSAITYELDDDFNRIEKMVVNKVSEPAFNFTITGDSVKNIYHYFDRNGLLEKNGQWDYFRPMPLVSSFVEIPSDTQLNIRAMNYRPSSTDKEISCLFFQQLVLDEVTPEMWKSAPDALSRLFSNISRMTMQINKKGKDVIITGIVQKKKNAQPILKF